MANRDGTAFFYNRITMTLARFTENDTFRSNQIREGMISREAALARIVEENKPRFETIFWYLNTIGLEMEMKNVLRIIHSIPGPKQA